MPMSVLDAGTWNCLPGMLAWRNPKSGNDGEPGLFVALVGVPGDGRARAFLDGGAGDAAHKLVRITAGQLNVAALDFANLAQDGGFGLQILVFSDGAFFQLDLKVKKLLFERGVVCPLLFSHLEQSAHNEVPSGEGRQQ